MRSGMSRAAGLPATLALAAPGLLAVPAPCRRRPVKLRLGAAFGVFHVRFPSRRASPKGMQQALIRFLRCRKDISARRNRQILFWTRDLRIVDRGPHSTGFFSKQVFAIFGLLFISAAHQPNRPPVCLLGNSSMVEQRTLTPSILVRIQVPQPNISSIKNNPFLVGARHHPRDLMLHMVQDFLYFQRLSYAPGQFRATCKLHIRT